MEGRRAFFNCLLAAVITKGQFWFLCFGSMHTYYLQVPLGANGCAYFRFDAEFRNTGLERSEALAKDLTWLKEQGHSIPEPSQPGLSYSAYLEELSKNDPQAFICHFYNTYFAHSAGGQMIGRKVAEKVNNGKELEFYKWDGDLSQLLQSVRNKLNTVAENWTREEKYHCLEETEKSFKHSGEILRLILS